MQSQTHLNNLNKDVLKYLIVKILPAISGLLTIYILTRTLSNSLYSNYAFVTATILLFGQLISGWINSSVIYFYPDYQAKNILDVLKINIIFLQLILYFIGAVGFSVMCYVGLNDFLIIIIGLFLMLSQTFVNLLYSFLQAERRVLVQITSTFIQSIVQIIGVACCYFYFKENLNVIFGVFFLSYFLASNYVMYSDKVFGLLLNKNVFSVFDFEIAKKVLKYGIPICIWFFASQFFAIGDRILFKYFDVTNLVGNYASFRDLSVGLSGFITMPLLMASHPIIIQMAKAEVDKIEIENVIIQNIKLLTTLFTSVFMGVFFIGKYVLVYIVGEKYLLETNLMFLVVFSIFLATISMYLHKGLEVKGKTFLMAKIALVVAGLSLVLNLFLIPIYGVYGACWVLVLAQVLYNGFVYYYSADVYCVKIPFIFILKNLFFVFLSFFLSNYILIENSHLIIRFFIFAVFSILVLFNSAEIKILLKTINHK